jgi:AraC-like DNA-binding protein
MKSRLDRITDWDQRLQDVKWQAKALAWKCGIGEWELRHYIHLKFGLPLHTWITSKRMAPACALLAQGKKVKEVAWAVGYKQPSHFSREFKLFYRISPTDFTSKDNYFQKSPD